MANFTATIGGASVNVIAHTLKVTNTVGQRSTGSMGIWTAPGTLYQYGTRVQIFDDLGALVYSGFTTKDKAVKGSRQGQGFLEHTVQLMDNAYKADKRRVIGKSYLGSTAGQIVTDLLNSFLIQEGVTSAPGTIASGPVITEVIWNGAKSVSEALTWLATQAGYWWNIDVNSVLHFLPYGGIPATNSVDGTQLDSQKGLSIEYGNELYVNKQYAKGSYDEKLNLVETFHGDGIKKGFTLSYEISSLKPTRKQPGLGVTLNGVTQSLGTKGVDNGKPFYWAKGDAVLAQDPANTPLGSGDTLVVTYNGRFPVLAVAQNPALIAAQKAREGGGTGLVEATYSNTKVHTLAAAFQIAGSLLAHYGQDMITLEFDTRQKGWMPGQSANVNLPDFGLTNKQMLVSSVEITDSTDGINIWYHVTAVGSPVESAQWQTYWQNLMNQSSDPSDLTDISNSSLAFLLAGTVVLTWVGTVTKSQFTCPIWSNATIFNNTTVFC